MTAAPDLRDAAALRAALAGPERVGIIAAAAEAGVAEAQAVYAQMLLDGAEVPADPPAAFRWFARAAAQEHLPAINMVGRCHDLGWGTPTDKVQAAAWFHAAAMRGLDWGMYNYATLLTLGQGVAEDRAQALDWFRRAAALGNAKAMNFVGSFHEDGWVVTRDMRAAARWYARAAEGRDFRGAFNHARMLLEAGDTAGACDWIVRAAADGNERFVGQVRDWLAALPDRAFGTEAQNAIDSHYESH